MTSIRVIERACEVGLECAESRSGMTVAFDDESRVRFEFTPHGRELLEPAMTDPEG
ncbi:MAG: hypothetical protein AB7I19_20340 [Planctomycetota bacterium]